MDHTSLKNKFKQRDRVIRFVSKNGKFRISMIKATNICRTAQDKHELHFVAASLLSRQLMAASLLSSFLKGEERITIESESDGPIGKIYAEAIHLGEVRGFVKINHLEKLDNLAKIDDAVGLGLFKVSKVLYDHPTPVQGIVPLDRGDVTSDLSSYLAQSDQIASYVGLDVKLDDEGNISKAAGILAQALPGTSEQESEVFFSSLKNIKSISEILCDSELALHEVGENLINHPVELVKNLQVDFFCRCNKDKFLNQLVLIGADEIKEMQKDNNNELVCNYCNSKYYIEKEDFEKLITNIQAKLN